MFTKVAKRLSLHHYGGMPRQELIAKIPKARAARRRVIFSEGVLECFPEGYGFLRAENGDDLAGHNGIYVSAAQIRRFDLRTGDTVSGQVRPPKDGERYFELTKIEAVIFVRP